MRNSRSCATRTHERLHRHRVAAGAACRRRRRPEPARGHRPGGAPRPGAASSHGRHDRRLRPHDPTIFEDSPVHPGRPRPISMTGLLNAVPRTPLYERLKAAVVWSRPPGDQFVFTNIIRGDVAPRALRGLQALLQRCTTTATSAAGRWTSSCTAAPRSPPRCDQLRDLRILLRWCDVHFARLAPRLDDGGDLHRDGAPPPPPAPTRGLERALHRHFSGYVRDVSGSSTPDRELRVLPEAGLLPGTAPPPGPSAA